MPPVSRVARRVLPLLASTALLVPASARAQDVGPLVVGGTTAEAGEYPWQIALLKQQGNKLFFTCGGTLIAEQRVLTAAHCTSGNAGSLKVLIGTQTLSSGGTVLNVSSYADHPSYSSSTDRFDAAVLELASSGTAAGGQVLQLIGAEGTADDALWATGKPLAISGWGTTSEGGSVSNQLREARVPRVADSTCGQSDYYGGSFDAATMVCGGLPEGGIDTCQGDSGGPLAASTEDPPPTSENDPSHWRLVGITSWGAGCARPKKPGVYTRVAAPDIRNWILGTGTPIFTLTVSLTGTGSGTVTDLGHADTIGCPPDCSFGYDSGTVVTLTADADSGSTFTGWSGSGCTGTGTCTVTMSQARSVAAQFTNSSPTPTMRTLTVVKQGGGSGTVTSSPVGISCGATCSSSFTDGTSVTLSAAPSSGSNFAGWDGEGCSGTGTCIVSMTAARDVTATFGVVTQEPLPPPPDDPPPDDDPDPTPDPEDPLDPVDETPPVAEIASERLRMTRRGFVRIRIECDAGEPGQCLGVVRLRRRLPEGSATVTLVSTIGRASFAFAPGERGEVKLRLKRRARRLVRERGRVRVRVVVVVQDAAGNTRTLRKRLTLRAPSP